MNTKRRRGGAGGAARRRRGRGRRGRGLGCSRKCAAGGHPISGRTNAKVAGGRAPRWRAGAPLKCERRRRRGGGGGERIPGLCRGRNGRGLETGGLPARRAPTAGARARVGFGAAAGAGRARGAAADAALAAAGIKRGGGRRRRGVRTGAEGPAKPAHPHAAVSLPARPRGRALPRRGPPPCRRDWLRSAEGLRAAGLAPKARSGAATAYEMPRGDERCEGGEQRGEERANKEGVAGLCVISRQEDLNSASWQRPR